MLSVLAPQWDGVTPVDEVLRALDDLVNTGKVFILVSQIRLPGWFTSHAIADLRGWSRFVAYQGEYSLASRAPERDIRP